MRKVLLFLSVVVLSFMFIGRLEAKTIEFKDFTKQLEENLKNSENDIGKQSKFVGEDDRFEIQYKDLKFEMTYKDYILSYEQTYEGLENDEKIEIANLHEFYLGEVVNTLGQMYGYTEDYNGETMDDIFNNNDKFSLEESGILVKQLESIQDMGDRPVINEFKISLKGGFGSKYEPEKISTTKNDMEQTTKDEAENPKTSDSASVLAFASLVSFFLIVVGVKKLKKIKLR